MVKVSDDEMFHPAKRTQRRKARGDGVFHGVSKFGEANVLINPNKKKYLPLLFN